jgi:hypothetical protein
MTTGDSPQTDITSSTAFNDALKSILIEAHDNDVSVEGGWNCRNGSLYPDWDIVVTEVEKDEEDTT